MQKKSSLCVFQASYNVGGYNISIGDIQRTILGCRLPRPGQVSFRGSIWSNLLSMLSIR